MLDIVKHALRISSDDFNMEIIHLIDSAKSDLKLSGVVNVDDDDPLIKRAIITYCKANFGWDNPEAERFAKSYDMLKAHLALSQEYTTAGDGT